MARRCSGFLNTEERTANFRFSYPQSATARRLASSSSVVPLQFAVRLNLHFGSLSWYSRVVLFFIQHPLIVCLLSQLLVSAFARTHFSACFFLDLFLRKLREVEGSRVGSRFPSGRANSLFDEATNSLSANTNLHYGSHSCPSRVIGLFFSIRWLFVCSRSSNFKLYTLDFLL
jgi:hypothetical protein